MAWLITMLVIGLVTGWLMGSLTEGRGPGTAAKVITGVVGSFFGGFLFATFGERLVGEGPLYLASLLVALVSAVVFILLLVFIKR
jgi:uncharacterized membrane protein YeaQ/YmgE (transglycosylase-associated protein family)